MTRKGPLSAGRPLESPIPIPRRASLGRWRLLWCGLRETGGLGARFHPPKPATRPKNSTTPVFWSRIKYKKGWSA